MGWDAVVPASDRGAPPSSVCRLMTRGKQWIHFDAQFPLKFGHDLCVRFGPAGQLLFIQFLCACKRSYPQGRIHYRTEDELRVLLGAHYSFVDEAGDKWTLGDYWRWCGRRKVTSTRARGGRIYVTATRWDAWEDDYNASERRNNASERQRKRRSAAKNVTPVTPKRLEVGGWSKRRLEVRGGSAEGGEAGAGDPVAGPLAEKLLTHLDEIKSQAEQQTNDHQNGDGS